MVTTVSNSPVPPGQIKTTGVLMAQNHDGNEPPGWIQTQQWCQSKWQQDKQKLMGINAADNTAVAPSL